MDLKQYKALIFDLDNTIVASEIFHIRALSAALKHLLNYDMTWDDGQEYIGITSREMGGRICRRIGRTDVTGDDIAKLKTDILFRMFQVNIYPGVAEFIHAVKGKYQLIIASNSVPGFINRVLHEGNLDDCFDRIFSCNDVTHTKPAPEIFLKVLADTGLKAEECLVFEDSDAGLQSAATAGIDTVLVLNPGNPIPTQIPSNQFMATWQQLLEKVKSELL